MGAFFNIFDKLTLVHCPDLPYAKRNWQIEDPRFSNHASHEENREKLV